MGFSIGLSGLNAASKSLDVIGNNVANANTVGFKQSNVHFADLYANSLSGAGNNQVGLGVTADTIQPLMTQGNVNSTNNPLDVAINGAGFFRLDNNGTISYSRNGQFHIDANGFLVNDQNLKVSGYLANSSGVVTTTNATPLVVSKTDLQPNPTSSANINLNMNSNATIPTTTPFNPLNTATYNNATSIPVFDSLGNSHTLNIYMSKSATNQWDMNYTLDGGATSIGTNTLNFNSNGALTTTPSTYVIPSIALPNGAAPLNITLDYGTSTQIGSVFTVNQLTQNGFASGKLTNLSVDSKGFIVGQYSNGQTKTQGQIALTNFANPQGLQNIGNNQWVETAGSGIALNGIPGTGNLGAIQASAVESSNVDLTAELVNMITAQRMYQANSQTIKTQDQVLQTLVNLR